MSGISFRDALTIDCRCGLRYLWEERSGFGTDGEGNLADSPVKTTIRDWYRPNSEPVNTCPCGADLMQLARGESLSMSKTYQVREYPLEIEITSEGAYWSKGWHPKKEFVDEANYESSREGDDDAWEPDDVRYETWRCVPAPYEDFYMYLLPAQLGTHGAFPVTVVGG